MIVKRIAAFLIDYLIVISYAIVLFFISISLLKSVIKDDNFTISFSPGIGQLIGFATLTLPVFLYFFLLENGKRNATLGKRAMKISVFNLNMQKATRREILIRNVLKLLPWEIAHLGVHWIIFYNDQDLDPPLWVFVLLILPQVFVIACIISVFATNGRSSLYDNIAGTVIGIGNKNENLTQQI